MRARHACLSRRAPRFILAGALGSPQGESRVSDCVRQADAGRVAGAGPGLGPPPLPVLARCSPSTRVCVQERRTRGVGTIACQDVLEGAKPRGRLGEHPLATRRWPRPRPCSRTFCPWGQTLPRPAGGQLNEQQQGRRLPPTPADPGALPLPEGGGTLGRPLRCPPRARGSTGGSGLAARRLPLAPAPAIRCPARRPVRSSTCSQEGDEAGAASEEDAALP